MNPGQSLSFGTRLASCGDRPTEAFLICDHNFTVIYLGKAFDTFLSLSGSTAPGANIFARIAKSPLLDPPAVQVIRARFDEATLTATDCSFHVLSATHGPQPIHVQIQRVGEAYWIFSIEDPDARRAVEDNVARLTLTDSLTGVGNRLRLQQGLGAALSNLPSNPDRIVLMLIDLDRFKSVNDTLGHPIGDQLLRKVAERLRTIFRQKDMIARLGGDEFAVWLPCSEGIEAIATFGARIVDLLSRPFLIEGHQINIGASVGIALAPADGTTYDTLIKNADLALYSVKATGRGSFHFYSADMEQRAHERRLLEIDLRKSLSLNQFELQYRPLIDVESRYLTGLEAQLRWRHPDKGMIEPPAFMAFAEELGLSVPIYKWMLEVACRHAAAWPIPATLVVSISTPQFESGALVENVRSALHSAGLPPAQLELEITEKVLLRNEAAVVKTLHELKAIGVRIGIGGFGTGYASLANLDSFPFDRIKLDHSLVQDVDDARSKRAIVSAVVAFGTSLGVNTMVDGIHTDEQLAKIRAEAGRALQGFLSVSPVPPEKLETWFESLEDQTGLPDFI